MPLRLMFAALLLTASIAHAGARCDVSVASSVQLLRGVMTQKLTLSGTWGKTAATVFMPNQALVEAAVVFSHAAIRADARTVDMRPLALTLAKAGAVVIVPDRELIWPPVNSSTNREGAVVSCAASWIVNHTALPHDGVPITNDQQMVVREFYGYVGPLSCDPKSPEQCTLTAPFSEAQRQFVCIPVGETQDGGNTDRILEDRGLFAARWLQRRLALRPIDSIDPGL